MTHYNLSTKEGRIALAAKTLNEAGQSTLGDMVRTLRQDTVTELTMYLEARELEGVDWRIAVSEFYNGIR